MKKYFLSLSVIASIAMFNGCKEDVSECDVEGLICTDVFTIKTVSIQNSSNEPVILDSYKVNKLDGEELFNIVVDTTQSSSSEKNGLYQLISDTQFNDIVKEGTDVLFTGFVNDSIVVSENYRVGHDCCEVVYISGPTDLTVNLD